MALPTNRVKLRIVRGSYANIAASVASLVDGELCYAKDQNQLYMYEDGALTALDYLTDTAVSTLINGGTGLSATYDGNTQIWTINLDNTTVNAGTYGSTTQIPQISVNAQGQITGVSLQNISTTLNVSADTGAQESISLGSEVLDIEGSTSIATATGTNKVIISVKDQYVRDITGISQTFEPMGHAVRLNSTISFNTSTRTFTITPTGASYDIWCKGVKYTKTTSSSVVIPNTTGLYYIYFDSSGTLQYRTSYFDWDDDVPTSYIYWNATTGTAPYFADERHGIALDWATHEYLHRTRGAVIANGFSVSNYTIIGDGSLDAHAQIDLSGGTFFDEDLEVQITHSNTPTANTWEQDLQGPAKLPVFYLSGTEWIKDTATDFPLKQGTARPQYNLLTGSTWSTVDAAANRYITNFVVATHNLNEPVIVVLGQGQHVNLGDAEAVNFSDLALPGFPSVEFRPLYKLVFQVDGFGNTVNARLRSVIDIRQTGSAGVGQAIGTDHGALSGLGDDDHLQYLHTTSNRTGVTANIATSGTLATTNTTASSSTTTGALVVAGGVGIAGNLNVGGDFNVTGEINTINVNELLVEDKVIQLGTIASPTDATANDGGIVLKGASDKSIKWLSATGAWTFSEHINLASTKEFYINGASVLSATTLGSSVVNSSLTSVGTITSGTWNGTTIGRSYGGTGYTTYSSGELLIGKADGSLAKATLTAGSSISITNGDGQITINAIDTVYTAGDGLDLTGSSFSLDLKANGGLAIENTELALNLSATSITGTLAVGDGGTGLTALPKGSVLVANTIDTLTALDGGGTSNKFLFYDATGDTVSWETEIDGGTF